MDGVLVCDKPAGMTSHDVVARVRRLLRGLEDDADDADVVAGGGIEP